MKGTSPTLFDKLLADTGPNILNASITRLSVDKVRDSVANDLESLLNTRAVISEESLLAYPECQRSILSYGLSDFAGLSLASIDDRAFVCRALERAISRHEPRLRNVRAKLEIEQDSINKLNFAISALLIIQESKEPVVFDAILKPSSLQYSITSNRRAAVRMSA